MVTLCSFCVKAHPGFEKGPCYICNGQLEQLDEWIEKANELLEQRSIFCISTQLPKAWLCKEEEIFDLCMQGETIKQTLNRTIIQQLAKKGKQYVLETPHRIRFDFFHGLVHLVNEPVFFFGRYKKLQNNLSQTRWLCRKCQGKGCGECKNKGKYYDSVEEYIGDPFKTASRAENYFLHASGREDVDATNTAGRPFVLELVKPEEYNFSLEDIQTEIDQSGKVKIENLRKVKRNWVALIGDSHFDKEYLADVQFETPVDRTQLQQLEKRVPLILEQQTPRRVMHRRADLLRKRKILKIKVLDVKEKEARLVITAEAGTYIKEFITGDEGRTNPNISELVGSSVCKNLAVTKIYDGFLNLIS